LINAGSINATVRIEHRLKTSNDSSMKNVKISTLFRLTMEVTIYAVLVAAYLFLVLHFLVDWLKELSIKRPETYAFVAILLMIAQSVGLERLTANLVHLARHRRE
jgi:heme/copper-type cytochrome/quinol oxidase subunit 3